MLFGEEKRVALLISILLFAVFALDVVLGATSDAEFLSDVQAMLLLFATSIAFTVAILRREREAGKRKP